VFEPPDAIRYRERTVAERMDARLKDKFGGRNVWVMDYLKVNSHLMLGHSQPPMFATFRHLASIDFRASHQAPLSGSGLPSVANSDFWSFGFCKSERRL
jgi:hypothetical protein